MSMVVQPDQPVYTQAGFDYGQLAPDVRSDVEEHTRRLHELERRTSESIIEMGQHLIAVKSRLDYGQFVDWRDREFGWSDFTAKKFMQVARAFGDKKVELLPFQPSALYALASNNVPDDIREDFIQVAEAGQTVTHSAVQEAIRERRERAEPVPVQEWSGEPQDADTIRTSPSTRTLPWRSTSYRNLDKTFVDEFICGECGEVFSEEVWHCEYCDHHWSAVYDEACRNCYHLREGSDNYADDEEGDEAEPAPAPLKTVHVANNSGENEWYTPAQYIAAAREVMGGIDLDPASSDVANETVKAAAYYTKEDNGLAKPWRGRVWMNPPYAQPLISHFSEKVVREFAEGNISEAIVLVNNATETRAWQTLAKSCTAVCFPQGRIRYLDATGTPANTPLQGQAFLYFGKKAYRFAEVFHRFGVVL